MKRQKRNILYGLNEDQYSLKGIWLFALLYFGSLVAGAIISLIAYRLTHYFDPDASSYLANKPYPKFFDRARWLSVIILLPYLFVKCRITSFAAIGFAKPFLSTFFTWFAYGIAMILLIYGFNTAIGAFDLTFDTSGSELLENLAVAIVGSLLIGCLEEIVFRGLVFRLFYTALKPIPAILVSSFFFALLHFKTPEFSLEGLSPQDIGIAEAAQIAIGTAIAFVTQFDPTYLLAIFLVGIVLHQVFLLGQNLWASIAIHAGWVFCIKAFGTYFSTTDSAGTFSGTTRVADGYWVSIVLAIFIAWYGFLLYRKEKPRD